MKSPLPIKLYRSTFLVFLAFSSLNVSCTGDSDDAAAAATTVSGDGAAATFPPGTLALGTTATVGKVDVPSEFASLTDAPDASLAIEVKGVKDGKAVTTELATPFTLQIDLTVVPAAALDEQAKTEANLCVVAKSSAGVLYVWRKSNLTYASSKVTVSTKYFGIFQVRYCGDLGLEAYTTVEAATETTTPAGETSTSTLGSTEKVPVCDMSTATGMCIEYPLSFASGTISESLSSACMKGQGTFTASATCPTAKLVGICTIAQTSSNVEITYKYFYYSPSTEATGLEQCKEDKADSPAKDGETKVYSFTKADGTKTVLD